jgi:hypothetical protein
LPDRKRDLERILRRILQSQPFSGIDIKPPIIARMARKLIRILYSVLRTGLAYVFAECRPVL